MIQEQKSKGSGGVKKGRGCLFASHLLYKEPFAPNERNK